MALDLSTSPDLPRPDLAGGRPHRASRHARRRPSTTDTLLGADSDRPLWRRLPDGAPGGGSRNSARSGPDRRLRSHGVVRHGRHSLCDPADLLASLGGRPASRSGQAYARDRPAPSELPAFGRRCQRSGQVCPRPLRPLPRSPTPPPWTPMVPAIPASKLAGAEFDQALGRSEERQFQPGSSPRRRSSHGPRGHSAQSHPPPRSFAHWTDSDGAFRSGQDTRAVSGPHGPPRPVPTACARRPGGRPRPASGQHRPPPRARVRTIPGPMPSDWPAWPRGGRSSPDVSADPSLPMPTTVVSTTTDGIGARSGSTGTHSYEAGFRAGRVANSTATVPIPVPSWPPPWPSDSFLCSGLHRAGDIKAVSHVGRTIIRSCVPPPSGQLRRPGMFHALGLEIDHVRPMEFGGPTTLDNLALLCHHHHRLKTYEGWVLERHGPTDDEPGWSFTPQPPFGQGTGVGHRPPTGWPRPHGVTVGASRFPGS